MTSTTSCPFCSDSLERLPRLGPEQVVVRCECGALVSVAPLPTPADVWRYVRPQWELRLVPDEHLEPFQLMAWHGEELAVVQGWRDTCRRTVVALSYIDAVLERRLRARGAQRPTHDAEVRP